MVGSAPTLQERIQLLLSLSGLAAQFNLELQKRLEPIKARWSELEKDLQEAGVTGICLPADAARQIEEDLEIFVKVALSDAISKRFNKNEIATILNFFTYINTIVTDTLEVVVTRLEQKIEKASKQFVQVEQTQPLGYEDTDRRLPADFVNNLKEEDGKNNVN